MHNIKRTHGGKNISVRDGTCRVTFKSTDEFPAKVTGNKMSEKTVKNTILFPLVKDIFMIQLTGAATVGCVHICFCKYRFTYNVRVFTFFSLTLKLN